MKQHRHSSTKGKTQSLRHLRRHDENSKVSQHKCFTQLCFMKGRGSHYSNRLIQVGNVCKSRTLRSDPLLEIALQQLIDSCGYTSITEAIYDSVFKQINKVSTDDNFIYPTIESLKKKDEDEAIQLLEDLKQMTRQRIEQRALHLEEMK